MVSLGSSLGLVSDILEGAIVGANLVGDILAGPVSFEEKETPAKVPPETATATRRPTTWYPKPLGSSLSFDGGTFHHAEYRQQ